MVVKKFEARSMKEALEMIKSELGPEAIIIAARDNIKNYGLVGDGSVEITAAIQEASLKKKNYADSRMTAELRDKIHRGSSKNHKELIDKAIRNRERDNQEQITAANLRNKIPPPNKVRTERTMRYVDMIDDVEPDAAPNGTNEKLRIAAQKAWKSIQQSHSKIPNQGQPSSEVRHRTQNQIREGYESETYSNINKTSNTNSKTSIPANSVSNQNHSSFKINSNSQTHSNTQSQFQTAPTANASSQHIDESVSYIKNEFHDLKQFFTTLRDIPQNIVPSHPGFEHGLRYEISSFYDKLLAAGIENSLLVNILKQVQEHLPTNNSVSPSLIQGLIAKNIAQRTIIKKPGTDFKFEVFIGAGGHGKTSSLIKRAATLCMNEQKRVAILSTDTKKLGADEQLKIYSQILNIPFMPIHSSNEWNLIAAEEANFDHILIDSPGVRFRSNDEIQDLKKILPPSSFNCTTHLVISATSKDQDAIEIGKRFASVGFDDIIFTALDESLQHGVLFNFQNFIGKPFHSFSIGPKIPEDFEPATIERVIDLLIGSSFELHQNTDLNF